MEDKEEFDRKWLEMISDPNYDVRNDQAAQASMAEGLCTNKLKGDKNRWQILSQTLFQ